MAKALIKFNNEGSAIRIKGEELKASIKKYNEGFTGLNENAWKVAEAVHSILTKKEWSKDFDSERQFLEAAEVSQSTWNHLKNAVQFRDDNPKITKGLNPERVFILSKLDDKAEAMLTWAGENNIPVNSDKKLKDAIKRWENRDAIEAEATVTDDEPETDEPETDEPEEPTIEADESMPVRVVINGKYYEIPWKVLKKYEVAE